MKYSFIAQHKKTWPIGLMCRLMGVSRTGFYHYQKHTVNRADDPAHQEMLAWVKKIAETTDNSYGSRRMKMALNLLGFPVNRDKARKLMKAAGVVVKHKKKYKVTTDSNHKQPVFDNLLERDFSPRQPDQVYAADVTYIWTSEGWIYLAVVLDLYSRKVVGWSMNSRMKANLVCDALKMALWRRRPEAGLIHHSDRGSQYASKAFRQLLMAHGIQGSMSRKGDCWDNAVVESFFGTLKQERAQWRSYQTRREAQQDILQYIAVFYNGYRLHSTLNYVSPDNYEKQFYEMKKVA